MENLDRTLWARARQRAIERDGDCIAAADDGWPCSPGPLHVHHVDPAHPDPYDVDNLAVVCAAHHARWEAMVHGRNLAPPPRPFLRFLRLA